MKTFKRAFGFTLSAAVTAICGVCAAALVSAAAETSGFSSGELLLLGFRDGVLFGEVLGEKFSVDFAPAAALVQKLQPLAVLLPPPLQLLIRCAVLRWG